MSLLYKKKEEQSTEVEFTQLENGKITLEFSADCGKFGADKIEKETPKKLSDKVRTDTNLFLSSVVPRYKVHYAPSGEWGNPKTACGRYWTTDVVHRALIDEVTCKHCLKLL